MAGSITPPEVVWRDAGILGSRPPALQGIRADRKSGAALVRSSLLAGTPAHPSLA
jgi:hypothetical protein